MNGIGKMYPHLNASELSNIILKGVTSMSSLLDKDAGFCSGSSEHEDDHHSHDDLHSPTDTSEDSVEVKFTPILKNKRKSSEPSRVAPDPELGPLKKRFRYEHTEDSNNSLKNSHFRPWAPASSHHQLPQNYVVDVKPNPADILIRHPGVTTLHRAITSDIEQEQPLALIAKKPTPQTNNKVEKDHKLSLQEKLKAAAATTTTSSTDLNSSFENSIENLIKQTQICRLPSQHKASSSSSSSSRIVEQKEEQNEICKTSSSTMGSPLSHKQSGKTSQRNYKNMTRERRIEANARERTRVHTISAAYDTLRKSIPSYSNSQKLSKLSVLRVACSYILYLSRMNGDDFSADQSEPPVQDCIDSVTRTIQTEGKLRRKKDE